MVIVYLCILGSQSPQHYKCNIEGHTYLITGMKYDQSITAWGPAVNELSLAFGYIYLQFTNHVL
jgi:hypothetical protein